MVSYGGGANSTALLIGLHQHRIPVDLILFADTGAEHPHTYAYLEVMDRWLNTYGFTIDLITEACQRTVSKIGQPSFQYAEGILSKWKEQGVRSMADVEQRDAEHQKRKKTASDQNAARKTAPAASSNRFNNFHQREYDYQKLEEQLLK